MRNLPNGQHGLTLDVSYDRWLVLKVAADSPADRAGIEPNDVIVGCHGLPLSSVLAPQLEEQLDPFFTLRVLCHRRNNIVDVTLAKHL